MLKKKCLSTKKLAVLWFQDPIWSTEARNHQKEILNIARDSVSLFYRQMQQDPVVLCNNKRARKISESSVVQGAVPMKGLEEFLKVSLPSFFSSHPSDHRVFPSIEFIWNRLHCFRMQSHLYIFLRQWQLICNHHLREKSFWENAKQ